MIEATPLPGLNILRAQVFEDDRGSFAVLWSDRGLSVQGLHHDWCQENRSHSRRAGTLRGLHYQAPPAAQAKLVSCTRGRIWDVAVDIRRGSPTYGRHYGLVLSANDWVQLLVPKGFLHGFLTLEDDTVTLRDRDTMAQERMPIADLEAFLSGKLDT